MRLRWTRKLCAALFTAVVLVGLAVAAWPNSPIAIERDPQPPFQIDPKQPFEVSLSTNYAPVGGGSSIRVQPDGRVVMWRSRYVSGKKGEPGTQKWETVAFPISTDVIASIIQAIESNGVMKLHRGYDATGTFDGVQKLLVIKQSGREKRVYCRNHFPESFTRFERQLEAIVSRYDTHLKWQEVEKPER